MPRLLIHFARYGPYHHARLRAAHEVLSPLGWEVIGLETAGTDATYAWDETKGETDGPRVVTAFPGRVHEEITAAEYRQVLVPLLGSLKPDAMAIAGWGSTDAQLILAWCRKHDVRRIVMSETRAADGRRVWWKELVKRYLISRFDGALVGGKSHRDYLVGLGMKPERIAFGYNVVDNEYFRERTLDIRNSIIKEKGLEMGDSDFGKNYTQYPNIPISNILSPCFLASNRFIERKNISRLIDAYARYACSGQGSAIRSQEEETGAGGAGHVAGASGSASDNEEQMERQGAQHASSTSTIHNPQSSIWPLVLLGDGEQKPALIAKCHELGFTVIEKAPWESSPTNDKRARTSDSSASHSHLTPLATSGPARRSSPTVFFPGFRQIDELPRFYAHAGCFIHPALEEPWGLVINEAMASGLPILSSDNVGAAEELVDDGVNGWKFDPTDVGVMAGLMGKISAFDFPLSALASASRRILEERVPTAAFGHGLAKLLK